MNTGSDVNGQRSHKMSDHVTRNNTRIEAAAVARSTRCQRSAASLRCANEFRLHPGHGAFQRDQRGVRRCVEAGRGKQAQSPAQKRRLVIAGRVGRPGKGRTHGLDEQVWVGLIKGLELFQNFIRLFYKTKLKIDKILIKF
jgi:hypothetical protein